MNAEELAAWPRTPNKPMAFTPEEFIAGAFRALGLHLVLFLIACVLAGTVAAFVDRLDQADSLFSASGEAWASPSWSSSTPCRSRSSRS
jgi:hypothetical protein